jgi:hypothetical protein
MFVAAGTAEAVFTDAGFVDFGQGTLNGGPKVEDLILPFGLYLRFVVHSMYV